MAFAQSTETIFYAMAGIMAAAAIVAFVGLESGLAPEAASVVGGVEAGADAAGGAAGLC